MTEKLFWLDPYQVEFTAKVLEQFPVPDGNAAVLDRTCFYATSGGQPNDTGNLDSSFVKDVRFQEDRLLHITSTPLEATAVHGRIDWERRFDHMQQHSGQHILSAAFYRLFEAETSSFHLGEEYCSIELNTPGLDRNQVQKAEELANSIIFKASTVESFLIDAGKAADYPLRKKSDLKESLRIVKIGDFDLSPCSGTHVHNTGEVGPIFITGAEKLSQTIKISFLCGKRVLRQYHRDQEILKDLSRKLTTSPELLADSLSKLQDQLRQLRKEFSQLKEEEWKKEAQELYTAAADENGLKKIFGVWNRPYQELRFIAQRLLEQPAVTGALISIPDKRAVFFKSTASTFDLCNAFQQFLRSSGAKGGGPPHLMEAGGFEIMEDFQKSLQDLFSEGSTEHK